MTSGVFSWALGIAVVLCGAAHADTIPDRAVPPPRTEASPFIGPVRLPTLGSDPSDPAWTVLFEGAREIDLARTGFGHDLLWPEDETTLLIRDDPSWHTGWPIIDPGLVPAIRPDKPRPAESMRDALLKLALILGGAVAALVLLLAKLSRLWSPAEIAKYLQSTGTPWGRREDLFLEKLILELRIHRVTELTVELAMAGRFKDLDQVERPLRRMRARFRAVRREYGQIAKRIGPVTEELRQECAQDIRRSGLASVPTLSREEVQSMRRIAAAVELRKTELQKSS